MPIGLLPQYSGKRLDLNNQGTSVTNISMDSNDTIPASMMTKTGGPYDDYDQSNRSTFSSDTSIHESILSSHSKENGIDRVSPRSSFTTVEEQLEYLRIDQPDNGNQYISHDIDHNAPPQRYSTKLNSMLFPNIESPRQEGKSLPRSQEYPSHLSPVNKSSDKSFLSVLKAVSEDAYDSSNHYLTMRKVASDDNYEDHSPYSSKVLGIRSESPPYNVTPSIGPPMRRESFPITRPIQSRSALGIAQLQHSPEQSSLQGQSQMSGQARPVYASQPNAVPWPSPNHNQNHNHNTIPHMQSPPHQPQQLQQLYPVVPPLNNTPPRPPTNNVVYQVQFKRKIRHFVIAASSVIEVHVGDFVKVEADRGEDLGVVQGIIAVTTFLDMRRQHHLNHGSKDEDGSWDLKQIIRLASTYERRQLTNKAQEEVQVTQNAFELAQNVYCLPMTIVDAEFQFDRHKLVIYYDSNKRIDFREFVRDLFALYKTRIWMQQVDPSESFGPYAPSAQVEYNNPYNHLQASTVHAGYKGGMAGGVAGAPMNHAGPARQGRDHYAAPMPYMQAHSQQSMGMRMQPHSYVEPGYNQSYVIEQAMPGAHQQYEDPAYEQASYSQTSYPGMVSTHAGYPQQPTHMEPSAAYQMYPPNAYYEAPSTITPTLTQPQSQQPSMRAAPLN